MKFLRKYQQFILNEVSYGEHYITRINQRIKTLIIVSPKVTENANLRFRKFVEDLLINRLSKFYIPPKDGKNYIIRIGSFAAKINGKLYPMQFKYPQFTDNDKIYPEQYGDSIIVTTKSGNASTVMLSTKNDTTEGLIHRMKTHFQKNDLEYSPLGYEVKDLIKENYVWEIDLDCTEEEFTKKIGKTLEENIEKKHIKILSEEFGEKEQLLSPGRNVCFQIDANVESKTITEVKLGQMLPTTVPLGGGKIKTINTFNAVKFEHLKPKTTLDAVELKFSDGTKKIFKLNDTIGIVPNATSDLDKKIINVLSVDFDTDSAFTILGPITKIGYYSAGHQSAGTMFLKIKPKMAQNLNF